MYLIRGESLTLVDAGVKTEQALNLLTKQLDDLGYKLADIEQIVLTHHHPDHIGLVGHFPNVHNIYGHRLNRPWLVRDEEFFKRYEAYFYELYQLSGTPKSYQSFLKTLRSPLKFAGESDLLEELVDGDRLPGHPEFKVIETPGHAQSHLAFYRETDGAFIGGDLLLSNSSSNPLLEPPESVDQERPKPLLQYRNSLQKCLDYQIGEVYPGHGPIFSNFSELVAKRLEKQEQRARLAFGLFKGNDLTPFMLCQNLFPNHIEQQFGLTMSETMGQLDYLEDKGFIVKYIEQGKLFYSKTN
ncbi:MBL fold metallo-hydrolase [Aquibacillus halophilus]|uniref:MBL fold metallo-hydrolase n=2 Tax=Aquibacillus halophilus TaxID=930132 RepID=A0A6A8DAI8_9BACI|nr:MBL fold metallo-hydrolase [Aquibacillus halophilus]